MAQGLCSNGDGNRSVLHHDLIGTRRAPSGAVQTTVAFNPKFFWRMVVVRSQALHYLFLVFYLAISARQWDLRMVLGRSMDVVNLVVHVGGCHLLPIGNSFVPQCPGFVIVSFDGGRYGQLADDASAFDHADINAMSIRRTICRRVG
jgi:hypothetical protein